jgi:transposase
MAKPILTNDLWKRIATLLPPRPKPKRPDRPGRPPIEDRKALTGILFVLKTGIDWQDLPREMGCGCGMTCWRRLRDWTEAGVWPKLHELLLAELHGADKIDWRRALIDSSHARARGGGEETGPSPVDRRVDRRKKGSKHHVITDAGGVPLVAQVTAANVPDVKPMIELVDAIPAVRGKPGRPRRRPKSLYGDRGYDSGPHRRALRKRGIRPRIARRRTGHGSGLGKYRWYIERTLSWLHNFGRLRARKDRSAAIHQAFLTLGCAVICLRLL